MNLRFAKLAALTCLAAGLAFPQAAGRGAARPQALGALRQQVLKNLDLTDAQKAQVKTIMQQAKSAAQPLQTQVQAIRQAFQAAIKGDASQISNLSVRAGQIDGQLMAIRGQAQAGIYSLLTPEQKAKLERMEQRLRQMQKRRNAAAGN